MIGALLVLLAVVCPPALASKTPEVPVYARDQPLYQRPVLPFVWWDEYFFAPNLLELETQSLLGERQHHDDLWPSFSVKADGDNLLVSREIARGRATETYRFAMREGQYLELAEVYTVRDSGARSSVVFDPPLPDLRFGAPAERFTSRFVYSTDGSAIRQRGEAVVSADLRPDTARVVLFARKPKRLHKKPVAAHLFYYEDGDVDLRALALASGQAQLSTSEQDAPEPDERIEALAGIDFTWARRPHRVSHFEVRVPEALGADDHGFMRFDGGTWASGVVASDELLYTIRTRELEGARFYRVSSPTFDLVQPVDPHRGARYVKGVHETTLHFEPGELPEDDDRIAVFINGFALESSYFHDDIGSTVIGFGVDVGLERDGDDLKIRSTMLKGIASVPERIQWLRRYAGFGAMDVVVAVLDEPTALSPILRHSGGIRGLRFGGSPGSIPCGSEGRIDEAYRRRPAVFESFMFWLDHRIFPGRFLRRMAMYAHETTFQDRVNNAGTIARPMFLEARKTILRMDQLQVASATCYEGVGDGADLQGQDWLRIGAHTVEAHGVSPAQLVTGVTGIPPSRIDGVLPDEPVDAHIACEGTTPTEAVLDWLREEREVDVDVESRETRAIEITSIENVRSRGAGKPYCVQRWRGAKLHVKGCDVAEVANTLEQILDAPVDASRVSGDVDVTIRFQLADMRGSVRRALHRQGFEVEEGTQAVDWLVVHPAGPPN